MTSNFTQMVNFILRNKNPWCKIIALDFCKGKINPSLADIRRGIVSKDQVLEVLEMGFKVGALNPQFYQNSKIIVNQMINTSKFA